MIRPLLACLLALLPLASHAQTLRIALREDADILDPSLGRTYVGRIVFAGVCDKLFDIDDKLQIVPQLATGYEYTDPKTLLIHLRPGVKFQDETAMDAAAVKYSLDRHATVAGSARRSEISAMDHVDVVDPLTVRIVLKAPSAPFLSQLTDRAGMVVSPTAAQAEGKDFGLHPVCAGPMKFVERVAQGPRHARALRRLLEQGCDPLRPGDLPADPGQLGPPGQPAGRQRGPGGVHCADRHGRGEARRQAAARDL